MATRPNLIPLGRSSDYGLIEVYGRTEQLNELPKKRIASGSFFYDINTGDVYMFAENEDKDKDGEWILQ